KRNRGVTQHQSALITHRRQQIDYMLVNRLRRVHARAREAREAEGAVLRAWKRIRSLPADYDSEEEIIKARRRVGEQQGLVVQRAEKDGGGGGEEWRPATVGKGGKEGAAAAAPVGHETVATEELETHLRSPRVLFAGIGTMRSGDPRDIGEEAQSLAQSLRRASRRLERWQESHLPGQGMIRRREMERMRRGMVVDGGFYAPVDLPRGGGQAVGGGQWEDGRGVQQGLYGGGREERGRLGSRNGNGSARKAREQRAVAGFPTTRTAGMVGEGYEDEGGGELDEEEREMLGEVDADEEEEEDEDEDEEMY
ncbi:hypothetical protein LTR33_018418, partial [Friedmanniomyces endolithicus]